MPCHTLSEKKGYRTGFDGAESHSVTLTSQQYMAYDGDGVRGKAAEWSGRQSEGGAPLGWKWILAPGLTPTHPQHTQTHTMSVCRSHTWETIQTQLAAKIINEGKLNIKMC